MKMQKAFFGARRVTALFLGCLKFLSQTWAKALRILSLARPVTGFSVPGSSDAALPYRERNRSSISPSLGQRAASEPGVGSGASGDAQDGAAAIRSDEPPVRHQAPAEVTAFAESVHDGGAGTPHDAVERSGTALPRETESGLRYGSSVPEARQGNARPEELCQDVLCGGSAPDAAQSGALTDSTTSTLITGQGAAAIGVDWELRLTSVWKDVYLNPYYDFFALADAMAAEFDGSTPIYRTIILYDDPPSNDSLQPTRTFLTYENYRNRYTRFIVRSYHWRPNGSGADSWPHFEINMDTREVLRDIGMSNWNSDARNWADRGWAIGGVMWMTDDAKDLVAFDPGYWEEA